MLENFPLFLPIPVTLGIPLPTLSSLASSKVPAPFTPIEYFRTFQHPQRNNLSSVQSIFSKPLDANLLVFSLNTFWNLSIVNIFVISQP